MQLKGSCHCQAVKFSAESSYPYPFMLCYCSICRKTAGSGGCGINLSAVTDTLEIEGEENIRTYHARMVDDATGDVTFSDGERKFCVLCGSALWSWSPHWPDMFHPHAGAIDTELPTPPEHTQVFLASKASWVEPNIGPNDRPFDEFPDESIAAWHQRLSLES